MHRWLSNDVNPPDWPGDPIDVSASCYACGVTLDCTESTEDDAHLFLPACPGPVHDRAHHYQYVGPFGGALVGVDGAYLDCAYGDATIGPEDIGAVGPCIGA